MKLVKEIEKELTAKYGMTDFNDFEFFNDDKTISRDLKENGYFTYGDAKTNILAIEMTLKEYYRIYG
ncbi:MAG: hypothetical protein FWC41_11640 [Firmicutes bacterium]|nr:hypothetical protein [Bacillota bacterium]